MTRKYEMATPYGDRYYIHENGNIERADMPGSISGQWRAVGVAYAEGAGFACGKRAPVTLEDLATGKVEPRDKSGTPRFTLIDFDHGSLRVWGNTRAHGIAYVIAVRA